MAAEAQLPPRERLVRENATMPIAGIFEEYLANLRHRYTPDHAKDVRDIMRRFFTATKVAQLTDIDARLVDRWMTALHLSDGSPISNRTFDSYRGKIKAFINWCVSREHIDHNALDKTISRRNPEETRREESEALTDKQFDAILASMPDNRWSVSRRVQYITARYTGLRCGELGRITWAMVNFDDRYIDLSAGLTKNRKKAAQSMPPIVADALLAFRPPNVDLSQPVFSSLFTLDTWKLDLTRARIFR